MTDDPTQQPGQAGDPTFSYEVAPPLPAAPKRRRRAPLFVAMAAFVVVAVGVGFVVLSGDERDPDEALAAAQEAVADATSFRMTFDGEMVMVLGDETAGSDTTSRFSGEGESTGERWHVVSNDGYGAYETILDGDVSYDRFADSPEELADESWSKLDDATYTREEILEELEVLAEEDEEDDFMPENYGDILEVGIAASLYLGDADGSVALASMTGASGASSGFVGDPGGFLHAIQEIADPVVADESGDTLTLATTVTAPEDMVEAYGAPLPDGRIELDLDGDDMPTALRLAVDKGENSLDIEIRFSDWDAPIEIALPSDDEIDDEEDWEDEDFEFSFDEESVREAAAEVAVVAPTAIPDGWELSRFESTTPDMALDTEGDESLEDCAVVEIDWDQLLPDDASEEDWEAAGYLYIWLVTADCALRADDTPFTPGGPGGLPSRENSYFELLEVQVGDTVVQIDTSLEGAELDAVLASLAPADLEALIAQANALVEAEG